MLDTAAWGLPTKGRRKTREEYPNCRIAEARCEERPQGRREARALEGGRSDGAGNNHKQRDRFGFTSERHHFGAKAGQASGGGERAEAVSGEIGRRMHVRQRKGEMMYQHPRWLRGFDVSRLTADQRSADRSKHRIRLLCYATTFNGFQGLLRKASNLYFCNYHCVNAQCRVSH
jgi:hypothetical protein